ncbi:phage virion morphogenesis (putative tail completion) protein [Pseudomonas sp. NFPP10]|uniref:phage virion morphogenesis protein n=1 Tax=unclassified Pseudomonas TaxID=196821 RepID=UPI0008803E21|nr:MULTISPECIES: phage virion morphogenesis protein [unclassified Pseudomonas]SDA18145.1 phage virion morphogenesis (putative tail completion) protein [Pseudomonas sp. NFPP12]SEK99098.1 phage virion morphogenesis (putative tail completion) protein [Pseudomonas sp. NFPP10]SFI57760.1 phage virion morphogenesis (putative tail completion) protein [Pseudomonas sp. NFPP08]SFM42925.1 phage virion morphogenesis (putative tail completion) protein [Pseudomonas sp. NFPP05]SFX31369.1 phage virion morphoge
MAGAMLNVELDNRLAESALAELLERMGDLRTPLLDIAEYLHQSTDDRFRQQVAPDGSPWAPLAPSTIARKGSNKILRQDGNLQDTLRHSVSGNELAFGTDRPYGAIHQFGGKIEHAPRSQQVYFSHKNGTVGNRFVKRSKSNFAMWTTRGAHAMELPARPYIGLSSEDDAEILSIISDYLTGAMNGGA